VTVGEWLAARSPRPPSALEARIACVLADSLALDADALPDICLAAGERLAAELLRSNSTSRDSALDLLTADALLTYAFEAASETPRSIDARAAAAMARIAELGAAAGVTGLAG
jgi:hypothetical protein